MQLLYGRHLLGEKKKKEKAAGFNRMKLANPAAHVRAERALHCTTGRLKRIPCRFFFLRNRKRGEEKSLALSTLPSKFVVFAFSSFFLGSAGLSCGEEHAFA